MPDEEQGDRPVLSIDADERDLAALGEVIGAKYDVSVVFTLDETRSIVRVSNAFVTALARVSDVSSVAQSWRDLTRPRGPSLNETLTDMRDFATEALKGPGIVTFRETGAA